MDWKEASDIASYWVSWQLLDWLKAAAGGAVVTIGGWLIARYRQSPWQRELRGAAIAFITLTIVMALLAPEPKTQSGTRSYLWISLIAGVCLGLLFALLPRKRKSETDNASDSSTLQNPTTTSRESAAERPVPLVPISPSELAEIPKPLELATSDRPENAEILFDSDPNADLVSLRFLPDTPRVNEDALLLIVFGYKLLKNKDQVPVRDAGKALTKSGCRNPPPTGLAASIGWLSYDPNVDIEKVGRGCVEMDFLYKGALASGGTFQVTERGARHALHLARDLIRRA